MTFPRKRAPVACSFCRHRKRKCDGSRPTCGLCAASDVDCQYPVASNEKDTAGSINDALLQRLETLEALLKQQISKPQGRPEVRQPSVAQSEPLLHQPQLDTTPQESPEQVQYQQTHAQTPRQLQHDLSPVRTLQTDHHTSATDAEQNLSPLTSGASNHTHSEPDINSSSHFTNDASADSLRFANYLSSVYQPQPSDAYTWSHPSANIATDEPVHVPSSRGRDEETSLTIPVGHHTTTGSLFSLEPIKSLIGHYPNDFFYDMEASRAGMPQSDLGTDLARLLTAIRLDQNHAQRLISKFFFHLNHSFPILEEASFNQFFNKVIQDDNSDMSEIALCLVVLALGNLVPVLHESSQFVPDSDVPGWEYFVAAHNILIHQWVVDFTSRVYLPMALILAAAYLLYLTKPLPAWRLIYMASSKLQTAVSQYRSTADTPCELGSNVTDQLCWICFLLECDILAELHLPRSGIEIVVDSMQFPHLSNPNDRSGLLFLALCSMRRLLNRIHNTMYASTTGTTSGKPSSSSFRVDVSSLSPGSSAIGSLDSVMNELARQLETWYLYLPDAVKPNLSHNHPHDAPEAWLRLRYWSAKHIISRPCLIHMALAKSQDGIPLYVVEYAKICVESCNKYLETAIYMLSKPTHYAWMTIQACLSCCFILILASRSQLLQHLVTDISQVIEKTLSTMKPWASPGSSAESVIWILQMIAQKQRLSRTRPW